MSTKKKKTTNKEVIFTLPAPRGFRKVLKRTLSATDFILLDRAVKQEIKSIKQHMEKEGGWDIRFSYSMEETIAALLPYNSIETYLIGEICRAGYSLKSSDKGLMITKQKCKTKEA